MEDAIRRRNALRDVVEALINLPERQAVAAVTTEQEFQDCAGH